MAALVTAKFVSNTASDTINWIFYSLISLFSSHHVENKGVWKTKLWGKPEENGFPHSKMILSWVKYSLYSIRSSYGNKLFCFQKTQQTEYKIDQTHQNTFEIWKSKSTVYPPKQTRTDVSGHASSAEFRCITISFLKILQVARAHGLSHKRKIQ